jgi:hypothetical protein
MIFKSFHPIIRLVSALCSCVVLIMPASARAQHSDIFVTNVAGQVVIGGANDLGTVDEHFDTDARLFEGIFVANFPPFDPADYGRDEPGFHAEPSTSAGFPPGASALPANASVTVHLPAFSLGGASDSLFYWNGAGSIDFQPISLAQPGVAFSLDPSSLGDTGPTGALEFHPVFELDNGGGGAPADGVYLAAPTVSVAGLADSRPFYMVWLADALLVDDTAAEELEESLEMGQFVVHGKDFGFFEEAVEYIATQVVPEPGVAILLLGSLTGVNALRQRRKREG